MTNEIIDDNLKRNNLDKSSSPYLRQHVSNPVWWQEWSEEIVSYASSVNRPVLVSVGYATCHWCHVMASEAFSDKQTACYLNENFICIKVDREQRPDIDQYLMEFINRQNGRGGWPLNVFLTASMKPVYALTYAPQKSGSMGQSFLSIAEKVYAFIEKNEENIPAFVPEEIRPEVADEGSLVETLSAYYDEIHGGFGNGQKFPSHSTLLYLLYNLAVQDNPTIRTICIKTLDSMRLRGLNDHLQGGIFRYCVDNEWTIPHFEKMLYDQAMALWTYSLAYRVLKREEYRRMAAKILKCLDESFENNGLYISAHDADTDHEEGATYLWSHEQLINELDPKEFSEFSNSYQIRKEGNFDGRNHLIRINDDPLTDIEEKLLAIRRQRLQPSKDDKILCGINALLAVALIQSARLLDAPEQEQKATSLIKNLIRLFWDGLTLCHSYWNGHLQNQGFLSDASAMLTAISMLYENDASWEKEMTEMTSYVESFREGDSWIESRSRDFPAVIASWFDHPVPSGVSMAEFGLARVFLLTGRNTVATDYRQPFQSDFYNITAMINNGLFHVITTPEIIPWDKLPVNSIQLSGTIQQDCYMGACTFPPTDSIPSK
jgi:uncharacterized protein YyaL (SSP411 family)